MADPIGAPATNGYVSGHEAGSMDDLFGLIRHFEASGAITPSGSNRRYLTAYNDGAQYSIGYGTNIKRAAKALGIPEDELRSGERSITIEQAEQLMRDEIQEVRDDVVAKLDRYEQAAGHGYTSLNDSQINALTSFAYNLGPGNLNALTDNGQRDLVTVMEKMPAYINSDGKPLDGLRNRRASELAMFSGAAESADEVALEVPPLDVANTFANLAVGEDVELRSTEPEDYTPDMDDPYEGVINSMEYVLDFRELREALGQPVTKIQYRP